MCCSQSYLWTFRSVSSRAADIGALSSSWGRKNLSKRPNCLASKSIAAFFLWFHGILELPKRLLARNLLHQSDTTNVSLAAVVWPSQGCTPFKGEGARPCQVLRQPAELRSWPGGWCQPGAGPRAGTGVGVCRFRVSHHAVLCRTAGQASSSHTWRLASGRCCHGPRCYQLYYERFH